jgi:CRP/FNR family cyclic AMP-dependent transcriptional regulator
MTVSSDPNATALPAPADTVALLQSHPLFGGLEPSQLRQLTNYARIRHFAAGKTIFAKGDPGTALFAVAAGKVKISVPSRDGREAMFNILGPGEIFGEIALLDGQNRTADAVALTDSDLMVIARRDFLEFVRDTPSVATRLIELLCSRLRVASEQIEEVVFLDFPTRLARILIRLIEQAGPVSDPAEVHATQRQLSQMLGTTRETVNKQLRIWANKKLIRLERGSIKLMARKPLAAIAGQGDAKPRG